MIHKQVYGFKNSNLIEMILIQLDISKYSSPLQKFGHSYIVSTIHVRLNNFYVIVWFQVFQSNTYNLV